MKASARVTENKDAAEALRGATRKQLLDAAQVGFNKAREEAPVGRDGFLQGAGMYEPHVRRDGSVEWGNTAAYAKWVEEGTDPHTPPLEPLLRWADRVIGSPVSADEILLELEEHGWHPGIFRHPGAAVWSKIRSEGTQAQPFIQPGIDAMKSWMASHGLDDAFVERL